MSELVANNDYRKSLEAHVDVILISQQLDHGIFNPVSLMAFLADLMKAHCAPIRDTMVDEMIQLCQQGRMLASLRLCFDVLERMKLVCRSFDFPLFDS